MKTIMKNCPLVKHCHLLHRTNFVFYAYEGSLYLLVRFSYRRHKWRCFFATSSKRWGSKSQPHRTNAELSALLSKGGVSKSCLVFSVVGDGELLSPPEQFFPGMGTLTAWIGAVLDSSAEIVADLATVRKTDASWNMPATRLDRESPNLGLPLLIPAAESITQRNLALAFQMQPISPISNRKTAAL